MAQKAEHTPAEAVGAEMIRLIRENREKDKQVERLTNFIIWSIYGTIIVAAVFLRAAGIM